MYVMNEKLILLERKYLFSFVSTSIEYTKGIQEKQETRKVYGLISILNN